MRPPATATECGKIVFSDISIHLRHEYITKLAADAICGHHLVCLLRLRGNEQLVATKTIPSLPGLLAMRFPDSLKLANVYADFEARFEVYGMAAQRESLTQDVKRHLKCKKVLALLTPKRKKAKPETSTPLTFSPSSGGSNRTSCFSLLGYVDITAADVNRTQWQLQPAAGPFEASPLTGVVSMKVSSELAVKVEHRGFLTLFDDVSGYGAWNRRWCHLSSDRIRFWPYPDDEQSPPTGQIDLRMCKAQTVSTAPREICARLHTLMIELRRPARADDRDSLILSRHGDETTLRHLLSCDTKEARDEWVAKLNKALLMTRIWTR